MKKTLSTVASEAAYEALVRKSLDGYCSELFAKSFAKKYSYVSFFKYRTAYSREDTVRAVFLTSAFIPKKEIILRGDEIKALRSDPAVLSHTALKCRAKYVVMCSYSASSPNMMREYLLADEVFRALGKVILYDYVVIGDGVCKCIIDDLRG